MKRMMTVRETARRRGCTLKYIYDLLAAGKLAGARKVGKVWRVPAEGVEGRLKQREARRG